MKFCTVATHPERYFPSLIDSCKRHHCELKVLGWQQPWKGFAWRYQLMRQFLRSEPDDEIIVFIDAFDVIILRDADEIERIFRSLKVPILVSTEQPYANLMMRAAYRKMYPRQCHGANICAGAYMGYAAALRKFFDTMFETLDCSKSNADDQRLLTRMCDLRPDTLAVDSDSKIFLNIHGGTKLNPSYSYFDVDNNQYFTWDTQAKCIVNKNSHLPCILHGPGNANFDSVVHRLGLQPPLPPKRSTDPDNYWWRSFKHFSKYFVWEALLAVVVLAILICAAVMFIRRNKRKTQISTSVDADKEDASVKETT